MKFCCGVTLFYPDQSEMDKISDYESIFDKVFVFDNTDSKQRVSNQSFFQGKESIEYITNESNEGLSVAFNRMCSKSVEEQYDFICLLDQDSLFSKENIKNIMEHIVNDNHLHTGIYVPEIIYKHKDNQLYNSGSIKKEEIEWAITSGSFIDLKVYKESKGFDENYFIDRLDQDYCATVKKLGYRIERICGTYLYQNLGDEKKTIWGDISQHGPLRHYYIFRNRFYFYHKHEKNKLKVQFILSVLSIKQIISVVLLEEEKFKKIKMMFKGYLDFKHKKMGRLNPLK